MNPINKEIANILREELKMMQSDHLVKVESERSLEQRLGVGRQRIRAVINQLTTEGLLIRHEGKGTYITPIVKNKFLNLICSPDIKTNDPFYNNLLVELTNYAAKESVNIIPLNINTLQNGFTHSPLLMIGRFSEEDLGILKQIFHVLVAFENYPEHEDFTQIYFDHYKIGFNAAKVLAEYHHQKVIHLTGPNRYASSNLRRDGFIRGAQKYNLDYEILSGKMNFQGGYRAGAVVKKLIQEDKFTSLFVVNDWMAVGLMQYLKENGVRIPEEVSIISVDNISLAGQISPGLTTYSLDMKVMIAEVFALLNNMPGDMEEQVPSKRVTLAPVLITRDTLKDAKDLQLKDA